MKKYEIVVDEDCYFGIFDTLNNKDVLTRRFDSITACSDSDDNSLFEVFIGKERAIYNAELNKNILPFTSIPYISIGNKCIIVNGKTVYDDVGRILIDGDYNILSVIADQYIYLYFPKEQRFNIFDIINKEMAFCEFGESCKAVKFDFKNYFILENSNCVQIHDRVTKKTYIMFGHVFENIISGKKDYMLLKSSETDLVNLFYDGDMVRKDIESYKQLKKNKLYLVIDGRIDLFDCEVGVSAIPEGSLLHEIISFNLISLEEDARFSLLNLKTKSMYRLDDLSVHYNNEKHLCEVNTPLGKNIYDSKDDRMILPCLVKKITYVNNLKEELQMKKNCQFSYIIVERENDSFGYDLKKRKLTTKKYPYFCTLIGKYAIMSRGEYIISDEEDIIIGSKKEVLSLVDVTGKNSTEDVLYSSIYVNNSVAIMKNKNGYTAISLYPYSVIVKDCPKVELKDDRIVCYFYNGTVEVLIDETMNDNSYPQEKKICLKK